MQINSGESLFKEFFHKQKSDTVILSDYIFRLLNRHHHSPALIQIESIQEITICFTVVTAQ